MTASQLTEVRIQQASSSYTYVKGMLTETPKYATEEAWADLTSADAQIESARALASEERHEQARAAAQAGSDFAYAALAKFRNAIGGFDRKS